MAPISNRTVVRSILSRHFQFCRNAKKDSSKSNKSVKWRNLHGPALRCWVKIRSIVNLPQPRRQELWRRADPKIDTPFLTIHSALEAVLCLYASAKMRQVDSWTRLRGQVRLRQKDLSKRWNRYRNRQNLLPWIYRLTSKKVKKKEKRFHCQLRNIWPSCRARMQTLLFKRVLRR